MKRYAVVHLKFKKWDPVRSIEGSPIIAELDDEEPDYLWPLEYSYIGRIDKKELSEFEIISYIDMSRPKKTLKQKQTTIMNFLEALKSLTTEKIQLTFKITIENGTAVIAVVPETEEAKEVDSQKTVTPAAKAEPVGDKTKKKPEPKKEAKKAPEKTVEAPKPEPKKVEPVTTDEEDSLSLFADE